jgi:hypothetical protein
MPIKKTGQIVCHRQGASLVYRRDFRKILSEWHLKITAAIKSQKVGYPLLGANDASGMQRVFLGGNDRGDETTAAAKLGSNFFHGEDALRTQSVESTTFASSIGDCALS